ncbi:hypothetical protein B0H12DRAFT_166845 [Mycena haematopus]|nr:hypothetical protein B0H12DRAFT_166845 [Mycena haematopus]
MNHLSLLNTCRSHGRTRTLASLLFSTKQLVYKHNSGLHSNTLVKMGQLFSNWFRSAPAKPRLASKDLEGVAQYIASGKCNNIVIMCGAGISRAAGIPDFRSEGGLYNILRESNINIGVLKVKLRRTLFRRTLFVR